MQIHPFFDPATSTLTYVLWDEASRDAVIIDPLLDFEPIVAETSTTSIERVANFLREGRLQPRLILETHAHADHLSGAQYLKMRFSAPIAIGAGITEVQKIFGDDVKSDTAPPKEARTASDDRVPGTVRAESLPPDQNYSYAGAGGLINPADCCRDQNALKVRMVRVSWMPGMTCTFSLMKWPMSVP